MGIFERLAEERESGKGSWSIHVSRDGVRFADFVCPGCRCLTNWELPETTVNTPPIPRCCTTGSKHPYPAHDERFAQHLKMRRHPWKNSRPGGVGRTLLTKNTVEPSAFDYLRRPLKSVFKFK
jgi:hypothetical protein